MKNTKSVGNQPEPYWVNAAKQIKWIVDLKERHISVPEFEIDEAKDNLMVQHFCNNGFFIQSCIPTGEETKVFNQEIKLKMPTEKIAPVDSKYKKGDKFKVVSTWCELEITNVEATKIHLRYTNKNKHDIIQSTDLLNHNLDFKLWERI